MICYLYPEPVYFFFASGLPDLLYYSHIPASILALVVGFFVFFNARHVLLNKLLLLLCISFSLWTLISLIAWTNIHSDFLMFIWSFFGVFSSFISILSVYFIIVFLTGKDATLLQKTIFTVLLAPVLIFAPTDLNISGYDLIACDAFMYEGFLYKLYYTSLGVISQIWISILLLRHHAKAALSLKKQITLMGTGLLFFLFSFNSLTFIATYLVTLGITEDSRLEMYGLFSMMVFMTFIGVLMVKFKTFRISIIAPQALLVALVILVASQFTFIFNTTGIMLTSVTLILTVITGLVLIRSVKQEIKQRDEIERLAKKLEKANAQLQVLDKMKSEFVSIASHQLRSPLTSIRGYASMLIEGSYGKLPSRALEAVERIAESSRFMSSSVEDYLNVSRIQAGNMKYVYSDFNLRDLAERVSDDTRPIAMKKGLLILFKSDLSKKGIVHADIGKTRQVIDNLVNNALKYTPKGSITIFVHDAPRKKLIYVDVIDTGIGMSAHTIEDMFEKFERAHNANEVNVTGTGLGLYIARKIAREMGGDVIASSEGEGKGSVFSFVLPLQL